MRLLSRLPDAFSPFADKGRLREQWRALPLQTKGMIVVAIPLFTLLIASTLGALLERQQTRALDWAVKSYQVRANIQDVYTRIMGASVSIRGLAVTGHEQYLDAYRRNAQLLPSALDALRKSVRDNPVQSASAQQLAADITKQVETWQTLERFRSVTAPSGQRALRESQVTLDRLRATVRQMSRTEADLLASRTDALTRWRGSQRALGILNLLLGIGGGYLAMLLFVRGIVRRAEYVEANAVRLAQGQTLSEPIPGSDALSRLSHALNTTAQHLQKQTDLLRESEARLRHVIANAPVILHALDKHGVITFSEGQALSALGLKPAELNGRSVFDVFRSVPRVLEDHRLALTGKSFTATVEVNKATFETRYLPTFEMGEVSGVIVVGTDVSERREAERVLLRYQGVLEGQNAELARMSELKDEFIAKMSHELRTPLTAIIGFAELLHDESYVGPISSQQREYVGIILSASGHLLTLINDLLDLSKIEAGMMQLEPELVDLRGAVANALSIIDREARKKALNVQARLPATLPPLSADARKVRQILYNLLSNAVKYTPEAGHVELVVIDGSQEVRIEIRDNGPGIAPEDRQRLFQPFVQLDNAADSPIEGTGLGLALTKQLVELHGGRVWLHSQVGRGSTFGFSLPRDLPVTEPHPLA